MRPTPARRFTIVDGMILVLAFAVGFAAVDRLQPDVTWSDIPREIPRVLRDRGTVLGSGFLLFSLGLVLFPLMLALCVAVVVCGWLAPRPRRRRFWSRPGFAAFTAIVLISLLWSLLAIPIALRRGDVLGLYGGSTLLGVGFGAFGAWFMLIVNRRWRPDRSWPDRLGLALGGLSILQSVTVVVLESFV